MFGESEKMVYGGQRLRSQTMSMTNVNMWRCRRARLIGEGRAQKPFCRRCPALMFTSSELIYFKAIKAW